MSVDQKFQTATIRDFTDKECQELFVEICENALLRDPVDVKQKVLMLNRNHSIGAKDIVNLIKKSNLDFELKVRWPKVIRTGKERREDQQKPVPEFAIPTTPAIAEIEKQAGDITNKDLKKIVEDNPAGAVPMPPIEHPKAGYDPSSIPSL